MTRIIEQIPARGLPATGGLYEDYLTGGGEVERRLGRHDRSAIEAAAKHPLERPLDEELRESLVAYNRRIGVSSDVIARLEDPRTRFVVTGQQPGALGGPLMTLYKIATAKALAEHAQDAGGVPSVALYWMGADDVDFAEVREFVAPTADLTPVSASIPASAHDAALQVGEIPAPALEGLWRSVSPMLSEDPGAQFVASAVESALTAGADHGEVTARIIAALTGGEVAVLDARAPALRSSAGPLTLAFFDGEAEVRETVSASGEALEKEGLHAQLWPGPDSGVFLSENGRRVKIPESQRERARDRIAAAPQETAPGVILRNLTQDSVFSPIAVVLGAAEIAYRAQIAPLYERFGVPLPVSFARLSATFVAPALTGVPGFDASRLVVDPAAWTRAVFAAEGSATLDAARKELLGRFAAARGEFAAALTGEAGDRTAARVGKRLEDVARRLEQGTDVSEEVGRARALEKWPFLEHTPDVFARQDRPQERYLSLLSPFLFSGEGAWQTVMEAARQQVPGAMDGNAMHVVYSA
jgi:hypothetical protein